MTKLKLYVWTGFAPDWTDGLAFAIAKTEKEARKLIIAEYGMSTYDWGDLEIRDLKEPCAYFVTGGS